jgi:hypothetical protein
MTRRVAIALAAVALAGLFVTDRLRNRDPSAQTAPEESPARRRVREFWNAYNQAGLLRTRGDFAGATRLYRRSLELNPEHEDSRYYLAMSLSEMGDYAQAEAVLRDLLRLNAESGRGWAQLGNLLGELSPGGAKDPAGARKAYSNLLHINQEQAGPFIQVGLLELNQGHLAAAQQNFRTAAVSGAPEAKFLLGYTLLLEGRPREAADWFRKVIAAHLAGKQVAAKGVFSEGDVLPEEGKPLSALERATVRSMVGLYWAELRAGKSPTDAAAEIRIALPEDKETRLRFVSSGAREGGHAAWGDFDGDSRPDLAVGGPGRFVLYRNGAGRLVDVTAAAGLAAVRDVWRPYWVNLDGDPFLDLYLVRPGLQGRGQNQLFRAYGHGSFREVTGEFGLAGVRSTIGACWLDADGDGRSDLVEVGATEESYGAARLFRRLGRGFVLQEGSGLEAGGVAVDCAVADYDRDTRPDLFVRFWRKPARLYRNLGGHFADVTVAAGLAGIDSPGLSAVFLDYDRDNLPDLLVSAQAGYEDVSRSLLGFRCGGLTPRLFHNTGAGSFREVTAEMGLAACHGTALVLAEDLDRDGWTDLVLVNGGPEAHRLEPSVVLRNREGKSFQRWFWLPAFGKPGNFVGAAAADLNGDRFPDLYLAAHPLLRTQQAGGVFLNLAAPPPGSEGAP